MSGSSIIVVQSEFAADKVAGRYVVETVVVVAVVLGREEWTEKATSYVSI